MKNVIFFCRCELTDIYGQLYKHLYKDFNLIYVAYSEKELDILQTKFNITNVLVFVNEIHKIFKSESIDLNLCNLIDESIIKLSNSRFNLNSAIQQDRSFQYLTYEDCLLLCQTYYKFWDQIITKLQVNFIVHEPTSLFLNHISALLCKKYYAKYISMIQVYGEAKHCFLIVSGDNGYSDQLVQNFTNKELTEEERKRVNNFLDHYREMTSNFCNLYSAKKQYLINILYDSCKLIFRKILYVIKLKTKKLTLLDHIRIYFLKDLSILNELDKKWGKFLTLKYDKFDPANKYYYYPIHLEPEAIVYYWGDGIYKNQVKLIENIAAQLPPNYFLYVKDHPHAKPYREMIDYKRIKASPNIKLLNPSIPGKIVIKNSIGVITINGTSGFEGLLFNKQVYMFGNSFYDQCKRVIKIKNIKELREIIYSNLNTTFSDDEIFLRFLYSYLASTNTGFIDYFGSHAKLYNISEDKNAHDVAEGLSKYFNHIN